MTTFNITLDTIAIGVAPTLAPSHSTPGTGNTSQEHAKVRPTRPFVIFGDDLMLDYVTGREDIPDTSTDHG